MHTSLLGSHSLCVYVCVYRPASLWMSARTWRTMPRLLTPWTLAATLARWLWDKPSRTSAKHLVVLELVARPICRHCHSVISRSWPGQWHWCALMAKPWARSHTCIHVHVCTHAHTQTHMHTHMHTHACTCLCTCTYIHTHTHMKKGGKRMEKRCRALLYRSAIRLVVRNLLSVSLKGVKEAGGVCLFTFCFVFLWRWTMS